MAGPTATLETGGRERETAERREVGEQPRRIIIPRRAGEADTEALRQDRDRAVRVITELQQGSRRIAVPADVGAEIESRLRVLGRLRESGVPFLQDRHNNEIDIIRGVLGEASTANREGRSADAQRLLGRATAMMQYLARIYEAELGMFINPPANLAGGTQALDDVLNSLEIVMLDAGTPNQRNADAVIRAANTYRDYSNVYNTEDVAIRAERDRILTFITDRGIRKGATAEERGAQQYTDEQAAEDERTLSQFERTAARLAAGLRTEYTTRLNGWRQDIETRLAQMAVEELSREMLTTLRRDIDAMLGRLREERGAREVLEGEILALENRYLTATGRPARPTREQRDEQLRQSATELRGTSTRAPRESTPEWFGQLALDSLARGDRDIAALALAFGLLERTAAGTRGGARTYLGEQRYREFLDVIMLRQPLNPVMASRMAAEIDIASLSADADRLVREYRLRGSGATRERLQLINDAVRVARQRISDGDLEGARRLLDMASQYGTFLSASVVRGRFRDWAGREEMESALRSDIGGVDSRQEFESALTLNQFAQQIAEFRSGMSDWGRGIAGQRRVAESALARVEELVNEGSFAEAQGAMMRILMYAESVERLGVRRGGRIESMHPRYDGSGMERALGAFVSGQAQVDGRGATTVFTESYVGAQRTSVDIEATRLADLATRNRWTAGRDAIDAALQRARDRAQQGDIEGAFRLLRFVQEYYGAAQDAQPAAGGRPAQPARTEGWRYRLASGSGSGFAEGRRILLDAIRMETDATTQERHSSAARLLRDGSRRIAETDMLMNAARRLRQRYAGEVEFVDGDAGSRGRVVVGYDAQRNPVYLDLARVRAYEAAHSRDAALGSGPTLERLFRDLDAAAASGDVTAYNRAVESIFGRYDSASGRTVGGRFWLVVERAARMQTIEQMRGQLESLSGFIGSLPAYEGSQTVRESLESSRAALLRRLNDIRYTNEDLAARGLGLEPPPSVLDQYGALLVSVERERRTAIAMANVSEQLRLNGEYYRAVGFIGGDMTTLTRGHLDRCRTALVETQAALREGRFEDAARAYERAIGARVDALREYWARNVTSMRDAVSVHRVRQRLPMDGPDERFFPVLRMMHDDLEVQPYIDAHRLVFRDILFGTVQGNTREHGERMQRRLQGTTMIEASIFGIPAGSTANVTLSVFDDFKRDQRDVRGSVYYAWRIDDQRARSRDAGGRAELARRVTEEFRRAQTTMQDMQRIAENNRLTASAAVFVAGVGSLFIPVAGPYISAGIFIGSQVESMATEYRMGGSISATSWVMFGLTVATFGLAAVGGLVRTVATAARIGGTELAVAGQIIRAEQMLTTAARYTVASRALTAGAITIGVGLAGYMEYTAGRMIYQASRETDPVRRETLYKEGILMAGMGLFPLVHLGVSRVYSGLSATPRMRAGAALEEVSPARLGETAGEVPLARRVQTADGMFEFLGRLRSTEAEVRAAAEAELATLPEAIRGNVRTLASNARIVDPATMETTRYLDLWRAFQSGELTPTARAQLEGAIARIAPPEVTPPQGPARGPGGGGPRTTRPEIDSAGLTDAFGLREFLHDLTIPDGAPQPALLSRASARAALARMRLDPRTAPIADIIDNLIGNAERGIPGRDAFRTSMSRETPYEELDPFTRRALDNTAGQIEGIVRPQVMRAVMEGTTGQPLEQVGEAPQAILRTPPTEAGIGGRVPVRATGETGGPGAGGRGPGAGEPVPGQVRGAGGGGPGAGGRGPGAGGPRGGGPRGRAPAGETPAEAAPAEAAQPQVLQLQRGPRWYSRAGRRALGWAGRVRRGETAWQRRMRGETELETIGALQESTDQLVVRGLDNSVRTSPQSVVEIMRAVYERAMAPGTREAIRGELTGMLQSLYRHPEVQRALAEAARSGSPDAPVFARMLADVTRGIDAAAGIRPGMAAEAANTRRQNYLDTLPELTQLQRSLLVDSVEARGTGAGQPLFAETQRLLGIELNGQQRAAGLIGFERAQRVPPEAVLDEMGLARRNALDALTAAHRNALDALPQEMRGSPVLEAVRSGLDRRLRASQGGDVSAMLLEAIRSPEVATAVERAGGRGARQRFERAVREGDLNAVLDRISEAVPHETLAGVTERIPREISEPLLRFARAARDSAALTDELAAMGLMGERFRAVQEASLARGGAAAMAGRPLGVGTWMRGRLRSRGLRTFAHVVDPSWSLRTGIADFVSGVRAGGWRGGVRTVSGWRIAHAAGHTLFFLYGLSLPGGRRIIPPYYGLPELCDWFSNSGQLREGNRIANEILGLNVSEDNARWLTTREGMGFALSVVVSAPYLRPRDGADLRGMLFGDERGDIWIDPRRINDALDDARAMTAALGGLNTRYTTATTGEGDARSTARTELNERLTRLGITRDDVRAALIRERERTLRRSLNEQERAEVQGLEVADALRQFLQLRGRTEMDISDLRALRLEDWRRRGVVTDPRRAAVETYFRDARIDGTDLTEAVTFFTRPENREAFLFLWTAARAGNLPAAYVDDAVRYLMRTTTLGTATVTNLEALRRESDGALQPTVTRLRQFAAGLAPEFLDRVNALDATARTGATDRIKDDARRELTGMLLAELLRRRLVQEQFYLEIQQSDATTIGIRPNSFLYVLDRRAWTVSEFRSTFESMLSTYRQSPGALRAFNAFIVRDDKDIFGDPRALAQRISLAGGRGTDGTMRPVVAEVNGLLGQARSANAAVRRDAEQALRAALAPMGITLDSLNARLTDASRREALVEDFVNLIAESARAEGIIGPSILANAGDRSMYSADAPALARFAQRYPGTGGLLEWIRNNRENITNVREILRYIEQNEFMRAETRSATDVAAFAERNADVFRQNGWFNPTARTALQRGGAPGIPATAAPRPAPAAPGRQAAPRIRLEFTPQFPGLTAIEMTETPAPPAEPAQPPGAAPAPAVVTAELTQAQRQQAEAFYSSERGSTLGVTLNRLLLNMYRDVRARLSDQERDGDVLTRCFGPLTTAPDGTPVVPPEAIKAARMEIYRILISPRAPDAAMRRSWLPIDGAGDTLAVTIDIGRLIRDGTGRPADPAYARRVEDPLCFRIKQFTLEQLRAREGGQPPAGGR